MDWGIWGLLTAGANGDMPPMTFEPFDTLWSNGIMARHAGDGRPLGHLHWHPHGEIDSVTVHPDFQRRGVASAMLRQAQADPDTYEASYPIRHSTNFSAAGRAWAQSDPDYHDPGDANVTKADDDPSNWGWTAVKNYVPAHVPYTGQNEEEMAPHLTTTDQRMKNRQLKRAGLVDTAWPKKWRDIPHPDVSWDVRWSPNHPQHDPVTSPWNRTASRMPPTLDSINPTGGVFVDYDPASRTGPHGPSVTTYDRAAGVHPDEPMTIYRGAPTHQTQINPGDFITTNPQLAHDYAGIGHVLQMQVPAKHIATDPDEWEREEHIYSPR